MPWKGSKILGEKLWKNFFGILGLEIFKDGIMVLVSVSNYDHHREVGNMLCREAGHFGYNCFIFNYSLNHFKK